MFIIFLISPLVTYCNILLNSDSVKRRKYEKLCFTLFIIQFISENKKMCTFVKIREKYCDDK